MVLKAANLLVNLEIFPINEYFWPNSLIFWVLNLILSLYHDLLELNAESIFQLNVYGYSRYFFFFIKCIPNGKAGIGRS